MKIIIDPERCTGTGMCTSVAPELFTLNDEGRAEAILPDVPPALEESLEAAVVCCPMSAISFEA